MIDVSYINTTQEICCDFVVSIYGRQFEWTIEPLYQEIIENGVLRMHTLKGRESTKEVNAELVFLHLGRLSIFLSSVGSTEVNDQLRDQTFIAN